MRHVFLVCVVAFGCGAGKAESKATTVSTTQVEGHALDVTTVAGTFDGYVVERPCKFFEVAIIGTGKHTFGDLEKKEQRQRLRTEVLHVLRPLKSVHGSGFGGGCHPNGHVAVHILVDDFREVDEAVLRIGMWLRAADLAVSVAVGVSPIPQEVRR